MKEFNCPKCERTFQSGEALEMHAQVKHAVEGLGKEERQQVKEEMKQQQHRKRKFSKRVKQAALWLVAMAAIALLAYWISSIAQRGGTYSNGQVHWHASLQVEVCGERRELPSGGNGGTAHGEDMAGTPLMHHHLDGIIHIEGTIRTPEEIMLGKFTDSIGMEFAPDRLMEKKNGDECSPGKPGQVKMLVNGQPNDEFRNYIPKPTENAQEQVIKIVFE